MATIIKVLLLGVVFAIVFHGLQTLGWFGVYTEVEPTEYKSNGSGIVWVRNWKMGDIIYSDYFYVTKQTEDSIIYAHLKIAEKFKK